MNRNSYTYDESLISYNHPLSYKVGDISDKQHEIVDKCLFLNKQMLAHKINSVESLQFSASHNSMGFSDKAINQLQFAASVDDVNTPFIGNWTAASLNLLIPEVGSNMDETTLLSLAFPDKPVPAYKVLLDRIAPNTGILPEFNGDSSPLPTVRPLDTYGIVYEPGLWAGRMSLLSKDIMFARKRGENSFDDRGIGQLIAYNTINLNTMCLTRQKYLISQTIFNNGFSWGGATIGSNIPTANYISLAPMGTLNANGSVTYDTSDPLYNPFIAIANIVNNPIFIKYRKYIKGIVLNGADLLDIMNHPAVKATTNALQMGGLSLTEKNLEIQIGKAVAQLMAYYAPSFNIPLIAENGVWQQQNPDGTGKTTPNDATDAASAQQWFVPRGSMYVLMDFTSMGGQNGAFHLTYNPLSNIDAPSMGKFLGVFPRNLFNSDTTNRLDVVVALSGAPAVYMPEGQFILKGLYSNVA